MNYLCICQKISNPAPRKLANNWAKEKQRTIPLTRLLLFSAERELYIFWMKPDVGFWLRAVLCRAVGRGKTEAMFTFHSSPFTLNRKLVPHFLSQCWKLLLNLDENLHKTCQVKNNIMLLFPIAGLKWNHLLRCFEIFVSLNNWTRNCLDSIDCYTTWRL